MIPQYTLDTVLLLFSLFSLSLSHTHTRKELCVKVIRFHSKSDVFEMVKNLDLPLEQGDTCLLKKLQALGLHPNR